MRHPDSTASLELLPDVEVRLAGAIGEDALPALRHELDAAAALDPEHIIVDVGHCTALKPEAINALLDARAAFGRRGVNLVLRGVNTDLARTLAMAGVRRVFMYERYPSAPDLRHAG